MKIGITVDDHRATKYEVGKYDFYTRQVDVDEALARRLQKAVTAYATAQRILSQLYNSNGRFVTPEDLEAIKCVELESVEQVTPEVESARSRKKQATAAASSNESQKP